MLVLSMIDTIGTLKSSHCLILAVLHRIIYSLIMKIVHSYEPTNLELLLFYIDHLWTRLWKYIFPTSNHGIEYKSPMTSVFPYIYLYLSVHQKALIRIFHTSFLTTHWHNNLWEFRALDPKFKRWFCTLKTVVLKISGIQK